MNVSNFCQKFFLGMLHVVQRKLGKCGRSGFGLDGVGILGGGNCLTQKLGGKLVAVTGQMLSVDCSGGGAW